jgi:hypothetical protein
MFTLGDKILISFFILLAFIGFIFIKFFSKNADIVIVQVSGKEVFRTDLGKNSRFLIDGFIGKTEIEIKDHRVRILDSPCNKKLCVHDGWMEKPYEMIICMPNRVTVSLYSRKNPIDAITR